MREVYVYIVCMCVCMCMCDVVHGGCGTEMIKATQGGRVIVFFIPELLPPPARGYRGRLLEGELEDENTETNDGEQAQM